MRKLELTFADRSRLCQNGGVMFAGRKLIHLFATDQPSAVPKLVSATLAEAAGYAPIELIVRLPDGSKFNLLGRRTLAQIETHYEALKLSDPFASNVFFQPGVAPLLYPLANRLSGVEHEPDILHARILGHDVRMPVNHGRAAGQRRHHLHRLAFARSPQDHTLDRNRTTLRHVFPADLHDPYWPGRARVEVTQALTEAGYQFDVLVQNMGQSAFPVGLGTHPYFVAPSGDPSAVRLKIPARRLVEIDSYENVLPTGWLLDIAPGSAMDFRSPRALDGRYLDNLWVDLIPDERGCVCAEFHDTRAGLAVRMSARTQNVIGIQAYAPKPETNPELGVFAALELVTNLPDPREELWGDTPTGMVLLQPGQTMRYAYQIEVGAL